MGRWLILLLVAFVGCAENPVETDADRAAYDLCYAKYARDEWGIFFRRLNEMRPKQLFAHRRGDLHPTWSPDGRYVAYTTSMDIYLYNFATDYSINLTPEGDCSDSEPRWTPNGRKIVYRHRPLGGEPTTYVMNPNGREKRQLLPFAARIWFAGRQDQFVCVEDAEEAHLVYRMDLSAAEPELVVDLHSLALDPVHLCDVDAARERALLVTAGGPISLNLLLTFDLVSGTLDTTYVGETGDVIVSAKFSPESSTVVFTKQNGGHYRCWVMLLRNGLTTALLTVRNCNVIYQRYEVEEFSSTGQRVIYAKKNPTNELLTWLYLVDLETGKSYFVDSGTDVQWNPLIR